MSNEKYDTSKPHVTIGTVVMTCDDCGREAECSQWRDTHYMICMNCAMSPFRVCDLSSEDK